MHLLYCLLTTRTYVQTSTCQTVYVSTHMSAHMSAVPMSTQLSTGMSAKYSHTACRSYCECSSQLVRLA